MDFRMYQLLQPLFRGGMITREESVVIAKSWLQTPYVMGGQLKNVGCDCATLISAYLIEIGAAAKSDAVLYSHDWFCNTTRERYMQGLIRYAACTLETVARGTVAAALPGDIVLFKAVRSRLYNHGGIVVSWPRIIHAVHPCVTESDATAHYLTGFTTMSVFDPWEKQRA